MKTLLQRGLNPNYKNSELITSLHYSSQYGRKEITKLLIAKGADVNSKDADDWTPLHWATDKGQKEIVELLIAERADVNAKDDHGTTPLHMAAYMKFDVAELLITKGANVNAVENGGETSLDWAIERGDKEMAELLIEAGVNIDESNNGSQTPLHKAAFEGRDEIVNMLIQNGAKVNPVIQSTGSFNGMTPVDFAIRQNELKTVALLRIHGGMSGEELKVFFKPVVENASQEPSETKASNNLMLNAVRNGNIKNVEKQLTAGADVKAVLENGMTALHVAAIFGHIEIVELLIANGTDAVSYTHLTLPTKRIV